MPCIFNAVFIKNRFDEKIIEELLQLKWWDMDDSEIEQMMPLMLNDNIEAFIAGAKHQKMKG